VLHDEITTVKHSKTSTASRLSDLILAKKAILKCISNFLDIFALVLKRKIKNLVAC
jgi:hypothetical protein